MAHYFKLNLELFFISSIVNGTLAILIFFTAGYAISYSLYVGLIYNLAGFFFLGVVLVLLTTSDYSTVNFVGSIDSYWDNFLTGRAGELLVKLIPLGLEELNIDRKNTFMMYYRVFFFLLKFTYLKLYQSYLYKNKIIYKFIHFIFSSIFSSLF